MTATEQLIAKVLEIDAARHAPRGHWRELGEAAPVLAKALGSALAALKEIEDGDGWWYTTKAENALAEIEQLAKGCGE